MIPRNKSEEEVYQVRMEAKQMAELEQSRRVAEETEQIKKQEERVIQYIADAKAKGQTYFEICGELHRHVVSELKDKGYYVRVEPATTLPGNAVTYIEFEKGSAPRSYCFM